jgi:hypothetical protein
MSTSDGDGDIAGCQCQQQPVVEEIEVQEKEHQQSDEISSGEQSEQNSKNTKYEHDSENTMKYEPDSKRCELSTASTQVSNEHNWPQVIQEPVQQGKLNRELETEKEYSDTSSEKNKDFDDNCSDSEKSLIVSKHLISVWIKTVGIFIFAFAMVSCFSLLIFFIVANSLNYFKIF